MNTAIGANGRNTDELLDALQAAYLANGGAQPALRTLAIVARPGDEERRAFQPDVPPVG